MKQHLAVPIIRVLFSTLALCAACHQSAAPPPADGPPGVLKCETDKDCPIYYKCVNGRCEKPVACTDSSQCPCGKICAQDMCGPCSGDDQCDTASREACRNGSCLRPNSCCSDTDCEAGYKCVEAQAGNPGRCEWVSPQQDGGLCNPGCDAGTICRNGECVNPSACSETYPCPPGYECVNGLCASIPESCATDEQCGLFCCDADAGACVNCSTRCSEGYVWNQDTRTCIIEEKPCQQDAECGEGNFCYDRVHKCRPLKGDGYDCGSDSDCLQGYRCYTPVANVCRKACEADEDCEYSGYYCDPIRKMCRPQGG